ncbi:MAG: SEC-C metal-binding domain-containing protein [Rhodothermales bacterium]|nr:SEC-C metal-binding domain-containing protein [Rhodothermales bacterium]MDG2016207.1 SEC-C metal-binding domain-containing protein [Rhodothermales bacterium]
MLNLLKKIFGDNRERSLNKLWPVVEQINVEYDKLASLTDEQLQAKTEEFRGRIGESLSGIESDRDDIFRQLKERLVSEDEGGEHTMSANERQDLYDELDDLEAEWYTTLEDTLLEILPEAFAVAKDACRRMVGKEWEAGGTTVKWDMIPYDVQLLGGVAMHGGNISEMKTGEGKTLVAIAPVYLNALAGQGVHLITVNPYLAERDAQWMGPVYEFLGLTWDVIDKYEPHTEGRTKAYLADITYGTNNEYGFDYLRDNSFVNDPAQLQQRGHHFAIVDEVDSVLIDEARTPLIISGPVPQSDETQFHEFKSTVEKLVYSQQKLAAGFVSKAEKLLAQRDESIDAGDNKTASQFESEAGLALLRAHRAFPKNKKLRKVLQEPGVEQLRQKTEYLYLQDNAKNMPIVDAELHFAYEEKQRSIELSEQGRQYIGRASGQDETLFVLPDLGELVASLDGEHERRTKEITEALDADTALTEDKRANKLENDLRVMKNELAEKKRNFYTEYSAAAARLHAIEQLLKAYILFEKDAEYIVQEGKIMIVDEHTGRVLSGRRYSDGLHQAIEAKEGVKIQAATQTYATITLQNYFRMYHKLAGMTGTAETEAEEFFKIYEMEVVVVPTNRPIQRQDLDDLVYRTKREKLNAVIEKIREYNAKGQPILVGTVSVEASETYSRLLTRAGIKHNVLNAKRDRVKAESLIVAEAGQKGAVTIATNMAGRGTDIKLGAGVIEAGGLAIIGTERHESRRIDLQLRGRSGRQGDPGVSQFYISLDDNLMRMFSSDRVAKVMDRLNLEEGAVITHPWVNKSIERAQGKVEQNNFGIRKRQLEYDDVLNAQRHVIYDRRNHALNGERLAGDIEDQLRQIIDRLVNTHHGDGDVDGLKEDLLRLLALDFDMDLETFHKMGDDGVAEKIFADAVAMYENKRAALARPFLESMQQVAASDAENKPEKVYVDFTDGRRVMRAVVPIEVAIESEGQEVNDALERVASLSLIDSHWTEHLRNLDEVKEGIGLRAYGQRDPLVEYKMEAFKLFAEMIEVINEEVVSFVFKSGPLVNQQSDQSRRSAPRRLDPRKAQTKKDVASPSYGVSGGSGNNAASKDPSAKATPVTANDKVGRNDSCPCGSGKKYKHCHGRT